MQLSSGKKWPIFVPRMASDSCLWLVIWVTWLLMTNQGMSWGWAKTWCQWKRFIHGLEAVVICRVFVFKSLFQNRQIFKPIWKCKYSIGGEFR